MNISRNQNPRIRKFFAVTGFIILGILPGLPLMAQENAVKPVSLDITSAARENSGQRWTIVIHGGAGGPAKGMMSDEKENAYLDKLNEALELGTKLLTSGARSVDVVEAVVQFMEDSPMFNAGIGAVLNENGKAELDAAIMDGQTGMAGAVAGVTTIKNPVSTARLVMEKSNHVMLIGKGAEDFAKVNGLKMVDPSYFITQERLEAWKKWKSAVPPEKKEKATDKDKHGTVGVVALDQHGNLAAATSTGGMMGKMAGRVGDSPIIGAGTYANNNTCAVSATGHGEYFIRNVVAYDLSALMEYRDMPLEEAAKLIVMEKLAGQKAEGGLIAVDKNGNIAMMFNTNAMFRGFAKSTGEREVAIY